MPHFTQAKEAAQDKSDTIMNWIAECDYIHSIDPKNPGPAYNNDTACFMRYCDMQAKEMERQGCLKMAAEIRQITKINRA